VALIQWARGLGLSHFVDGLGRFTGEANELSRGLPPDGEDKLSCAVTSELDEGLDRLRESFSRTNAVTKGLADGVCQSMARWITVP
jgi:hypothetical protein